jgi:iron complex outermembrane receptor protein
MEMSVDAGSFDAYKGRVTYGKSFNNGIEALVSGTYYDSNGDRLFFKEFDKPENNNGITDHTDFDRFHKTFAKLSYGDFTLEGVYSSRTKGIPTASYGADFNNRRNRTTDSWWHTDRYLQLWKSTDVTGGFTIVMTTMATMYTVDSEQDSARGAGREPGKHKTLRSLQINRGNGISRQLRQDQKTTMKLHPLFADRRTGYGPSTSRTVRIFSNLILAPVRYDHYNLRQRHKSQAGPDLPPLAGTVFKLLYGTAFRAPGVTNYATTYPHWGQGTDLGPEKIQTYELVWEQYRQPPPGLLSGFTTTSTT